MITITIIPEAPTSFTCCRCGLTKPVQTSGGTGYGINPDGTGKTCYQCCAEIDREVMRAEGRITLYDSSPTELTNWPGTLCIPIKVRFVGRHNWARHRYDVYFDFEGRRWHGVRYGDNTQIVHCRRLKSK
jgi:hypothetical protein